MLDHLAHRVVAALDQHSDLVDVVSTRAALGTTVTTTILGLTADEWGIVSMIVGIVGTIATVAFNIWFKWHYKRGNHNGND